LTQRAKDRDSIKYGEQQRIIWLLRALGPSRPEIYPSGRIRFHDPVEQAEGVVGYLVPKRRWLTARILVGGFSSSCEIGAGHGQR
jgi:hypothetical protein